jgi:NAD(P)-dependent dehydrogenase (short-subunit alcohol dehydrogenase family)
MFWLCKKAIPHMEAGATIINTSSVQAVNPSPQLLDYATTKAGIQNFTKGLAQELAEKGIRVTQSRRARSGRR